MEALARLGPTSKQLELMNKLAVKIDRTLIEFIAETLNKSDNEIIIETLTSKQITRVINKLLGAQPLSIPQIMLIMKDWPLEKINEIFKTSFTDYRPLRNYHMRILYKDRFNVRCLDHPIENSPDYEYGWQESDLCQDGKLYYLKFYNMMMLDYDGIDFDTLIEKLDKWKDKYRFEVYQTYNGYHVYVVSESISYQNSAELMKAFDCDFFYMKFVQGNGFKIRLTPKLNRDEKFLERWVASVGVLPFHSEIAPLLEIRARFLPSF